MLTIQPKLQEYAKNFLQELLPFNLRTGLIFFVTRFLFLIIVVTIYYILSAIFYLESQFKFQLTLLATTIIYLVFLLPLQEKLEIFLKKKFLSEYLYDDVLALKYAYRNFELKTLISNVFPDMVRIAGAKSGKMVIKKEENSYDAYSYVEGKSKKIRTQAFSLSEDFLAHLKNYKDIIALPQVHEIDPIVHKKMLELKVESILPFRYRNKLFGFLGISGVPNPQVIDDLKLLASKAAIAVFNHNLASQVAILNRFKQEIEKASKIQGHVFHTIVPKFINLNIEIVNRDPNIILEFFRNSEKEIAIVLISITNQTLTSGLVLAHVLGKLEALKYSTKKNSHKSFRRFLDASFEEFNLKDSYESLIGIYDEINKKITFTQVGTHFKVTNQHKEGGFSVGWKYSIEFSTLQIYHKKKLILNIQAKPSIL